MSNYSRLLNIFETLVSFRTVTGDKKAADKCLAYVENFLAPHGLVVNRYHSNGFLSLVATTRKTKKPKVFLQAHLDVVPAEDDMFTLRGEATKLVGRGAFDMKFAAACYLYLIDELGENCKDYDFGVMFTFDEEEGGLDGSDYLLDQGYGCDVVMIPDGGDDWRLESAAKGFWTFNVASSGKTSHASRPWEGDNAAEKLLDFIQNIKKLATLKGHTDPTIVLTKFNSGEAWNQVPDRAAASFDIRFLNSAQYDALHAQITRLAKKHDIEFTYQRHSAALELDVTLPVVQTWEEAVRAIRGDQAPIGYGLSFGASDARYFADHGIPAIVTRPAGGGHHGPDEWIDEAEFYQFYDAIKAFLPLAAGLTKPLPPDIMMPKLPETVTDKADKAKS